MKAAVLSSVPKTAFKIKIPESALATALNRMPSEETTLIKISAPRP